MKLFLLICISLVPLCTGFSVVKRCPELKRTQDIDYKGLTGNWFMAASMPKYSEKCKNFTISQEDDSYKLHEEYYKKVLFWNTHSTNEYIITRQLKSPELQLKKDHWYSFSTETLTLIDGDYDNYMVLYSCTGHLFWITENIEIWSRNNQGFNGPNMPSKLADDLNVLGYQSSNLDFRTKEDCKA